MPVNPPNENPRPMLPIPRPYAPGLIGGGSWAQRPVPPIRPKAQGDNPMLRLLSPQRASMAPGPSPRPPYRGRGLLDVLRRRQGHAEDLRFEELMAGQAGGFGGGAR